MPETSGRHDQQWMQRALELAEQSIGLSSPNPAVGCLLAHGDRAVGEGFHEYDKRDHAEIVALKQAGELAQGATAYVTLEPCSHHGRTGPCADALLAAGVRRVVIATSDPNPLVHGQGIARLRAGGVEVSTGVLAEPARRINDAFARFTQSSQPFVTMKVATTLDGRIAPARHVEKSAFWITGEAARDEVQKMRHAADALLVGIGTILADDPLLTDRSELPRRRRVLRVVLDSRLRLPLDSKLVTTAENDVLVFHTVGSTAAQQALEARGVRVERLLPTGRSEQPGVRPGVQSGLQSGVEPNPESVPLRQVIQYLGGLNITSLLIEGGAQINASALNEDLVDKLVLFYAPRFLGEKAVPLVTSIAKAPAIRDFTLRKIGGDFAFESYLRDPWTGL